MWVLLALGTAAVLLFFLPLLATLPMSVEMIVFWALVIAMAVGAVKLYQRWSGVAATRGVSALAFGLVANGVAVGMTMLTFLTVPTGASGRPMGLTVLYFAFALVMTPLGIAKAARAWSQERPLAISAMILSLGILPVEVLTLFALAGAKAFELEP
jgi:hypothetical protein